MITKIRKYFDLEKPGAATMGGWRQWRYEASRDKPVAYFCREILPDVFSDIKRKITNPYTRTTEYIRNKFVYKHHYIDTGLGVGYHGVDTRMLHGMFALLVDFVEIELAWMMCVFYSQNFDKYKYPRNARPGAWRYRSHKCPEAGVDHLINNFETYENDWGHYYATVEMLELYKWWTVVRPARPDPMEASGWRECSSFDDEWNFSNRTYWPKPYVEKIKSPEQRAAESAASQKMSDIEQSYEDEDTEMLTRLIKIRKYMWT